MGQEALSRACSCSTRATRGYQHQFQKWGEKTEASIPSVNKLNQMSLSSTWLSAVPRKLINGERQGDGSEAEEGRT